MIPPLQWDKVHLKAWSWLKGRLLQGCVQFGVECDPMQYESKVGITKGIYLQNF
jgi:hypothetical protein